ncbi:hypothetical protein L3Q82_002478 [Scortum barcoo]|uniref:Uncharacterized protein n=1 Tax=Scortum barcoo TaxID=214431 RepID=A0ACB8VY13_9TELE|nr:hypothetical protein L3Q82_002478 [Scortum barcoo]
MLSSKHGLAEYSRTRGSPHQPPPGSHSQGRANATRPSTATHSSTAGHNYGASQAYGGTLQNSSSSSSSSLPSEARGDAKQEPIAETPEVPMDILGLLKNSPHELAALYHRWGAANAMLDPTGSITIIATIITIIIATASSPLLARVLVANATVRGCWRWNEKKKCLCGSGERPFCCQLCPYRASQKGNLKTHVQSVHHMPFDNSQYPDTRSLLLSQEERGELAAKHPPTPQQQQ